MRGPKVGVINDIINNFLKAHQLSTKDLFEKKTDKGNFYFVKPKIKKF